MGFAAVGIFFGVVGTMPTGAGYEGVDGIIGLQILFSGTGSAFEQLFPAGTLIIVTMAIWTLVNFQGSEIVGLSLLKHRIWRRTFLLPAEKLLSESS